MSSLAEAFGMFSKLCKLSELRCGEGFRLVLYSDQSGRIDDDFDGEALLHFDSLTELTEKLKQLPLLEVLQ